MQTANPLLTSAINAADLPTVIEETTGCACPARGGTIHDPRPDYQERHASFSVYQHTGGVWFYKRRGGPGDHGTVWHYLLSLDWTEEEVAEYLISRFGNPNATPEEVNQARLSEPLTPLHRAMQAAELWTPLTPTQAREAWKDVTPLHGPALEDLRGRGLDASPVLQAGTLTRGELFHPVAGGSHEQG